MIDFPIFGGFTAYFISFFVDEIQYLFIVLLTKKRRFDQKYANVWHLT